MVSGFLKVAAAVPGIRVADCPHNVQQIIDRMAAAEDDGVALCVLPELSITGYTCEDLFGQPYFIEAAWHLSFHFGNRFPSTVCSASSLLPAAMWLLLILPDCWPS